MKNLLTIALTIAAVLVVLRQCRKPTRWIGKAYLWIMNRSHADVTQWGLTHVTIDPAFTILDVGCGGGRTIQTLASIASAGKVSGIDYSAESVVTSRATNAALVAAGRVDIRHGSVSSLPWPDGTFDLVTAVETHYYWPDLAADMREVLRVLKPGGRLCVIAETYRGRSLDAMYRPAMMLLRATYLTPDEHRELLSAAGFTAVDVFEDSAHGWICAVGRKG